MLNGYFGCCEFLFLFCVFFGGWFPLRTGKTGEEVSIWWQSSTNKRAIKFQQ